MWPEAVERIAAFLRASGVEGRLEELLAGAGPPSVDERKLAVAAGCRELKSRARASAFPFEGARVFMDQSVLSSEAVWLEVGSPRHVLGLSPAQIVRVTRAETADLLREG